MDKKPLELLSVVIPARDEEASVASTVEHLHSELRSHNVPHEIIIVDDASADRTWEIVNAIKSRIPVVTALQSPPPHGFGRAIAAGLDKMLGDAVVLMMADESDDCRDVVRYWHTLQQGYDCVFGSRFIKGGRTIAYPKLKLLLNRCANLFLQVMFNIPYNDTTNAFKAYRREVIAGCRPLVSPHFNITVELPLKAIVRGYSWTTIPISWRSRQTGIPKLKIKEMGSRYMFSWLHVWLEKHLTRGDYRRR